MTKQKISILFYREDGDSLCPAVPHITRWTRYEDALDEAKRVLDTLPVDGSFARIFGPGMNRGVEVGQS